MTGTKRRERRGSLRVGTLSVLAKNFENSVAGQLLVSVLVVMILLVGVVWSLPSSEIQRKLVPKLAPLAGLTGLEQDWRMFAPDPVKQLDYPEVRVGMADGSQRIWTFERGDPVLRAFTWGHWQKFKFAVLWTAPETRKPFAHWVVAKVTKPGEKAVRVQIYLRSEVVPPPPNDGPKTIKVDTIYDENLTAAP